MKETYYVAVTSDGMPVSLSRSPLVNGLPMRWRAYRLEAADRNEARAEARRLFSEGVASMEEAYTAKS